MIISKTVKASGGDYTSISSAFADMLVSGLAYTGVASQYSLSVDYGVYNETISGTVPYSGQFDIQGSNSVLHLSNNIYVSGTYADISTPNLSLNNFVIDSSGLSSYSVKIGSGCGLALNNIQFINDISGIYNNGYLQLYKVDSLGKGLNKFIQGSGTTIGNRCNISYYSEAIDSLQANLVNCNLVNNSSGVVITSGVLNLSQTLISSSGTAKSIVGTSGTIYVSKCTLNDLYINKDKLLLDNSIVTNISGVGALGSYLTNVDIYNLQVKDPSLSGVNISYNKDPIFNNSTYNDYRLKFKGVNGSPFIEYTPNTNFHPDVSIELNTLSLKIRDSQGPVDVLQPFIYTQGSSLVLSDYNKETKFAEAKDTYNLSYALNVNGNFPVYNVSTLPSFNTNRNDFPYDWDLVDIQSTIIGDNQYIIPRSVINIENIILSYLGTSDVFYNLFNKNCVKVWKSTDYRGVAYDYDLSTSSNRVLWLVDGSNQSLVKQDMYSSEEQGYYPLLCPPSYLCCPSGLVYVGLYGNKYKYIKLSDPNEPIYGKDPNGNFLCIPTDINNKYDIKGLLSFKGNLYLTATEYTTDVNRTILSLSGGLGRVLSYSNNDTFFNYVTSPTIFPLASGNAYPTDLTMYEDGKLLVNDFTQNKLYFYNFACDYCLISSDYQNNTKVVLREYYPDITL